MHHFNSGWFNVNVTSVGEEENGGGTNLSGWAEDAAGLHRDFQFPDFTTSWLIRVIETRL